MLASACWIRANPLLGTACVEGTGVRKAQLGSPPPRERVEDSGQSSGDVESITAAATVLQLLLTLSRETKESPGAWPARAMSARLLSRHSVSACLGSSTGHCSSRYTWFRCDLTYTTSPSPAQKAHLHPRFKCSVLLHGSGAYWLSSTRTKCGQSLETDSVNGSSVALRSELRVARRSSHGLRVAPRLCALTSKQAVKEMR